MTPRERVETVLTGGRADCVPFTIYDALLPDDEVARRLRSEGVCVIARMAPFTVTLEGVSGSLSACLLPTTVLWDAVLFLRLKTGSRRFTLVLPAASVSKENYRRMRICLGAVLDRTHRASGPSAI